MILADIETYGWSLSKDLWNLFSIEVLSQIMKKHDLQNSCDWKRYFRN